MAEFSFPKNEKLKSRTSINQLFENGNSYFKFPITMLWNVNEELPKPEIKVGFSVPKKNFKKAVHRNLLKRRMREAYRLNKNELNSLMAQKYQGYSIFFIYSSKQQCQYSKIESSIKQCLKMLYR